MDECVFLSIPTRRGKVLFFVLLSICFYDTFFSFTVSLPLLNMPKASGHSTCRNYIIQLTELGQYHHSNLLTLTLNWANTITLIYQELLEETKVGIEV